MTDPDGYLTPAGRRWYLVAALLAFVVVACVNHQREHAAPRRAPATTSSPTASSSVIDTTPAVATTDRETFAPDTWRVSTTAYCLRGVTASGTAVADGIVAVHTSRFAQLRGTRWRVVWADGDQRFVGRTFTVTDKGPGASFDVWVPDCTAAARYGRHAAGVVPA